MQTSRQDLILDTALYAASKALPGLLTLLSVVVFARMLSSESYGAYALLYSVASLIGTLASSWISQSVLRFSSSREVDSSQLQMAIRSAFLASFLVAGSAFAVLALTTQAIPGISVLETLIAILLIFLIAAYTVKYAQLQANISPSSVLILEVSRSGIALVAGIILLWFFGPHHELVLVALIMSLAVASRIAVRGGALGLSELWSWSVGANTKLIAAMFRYGWPLSCWTGCVLLLSVSDRYLIQHYFGSGSVGSYAAVYDLVVRGFSLYVFPVTLAIHPRIMAAHNKGHLSEARSLRRLGLLLQSAIAMPAFALIWLVQDFLVIELLQQDEHSVALVMPLAIGGFLWQLALIIHKPLELQHATKLMLLLACGAVAVAVLMNYFLLPRFGTVASAYAFAMSGVVYAVSVEAVGRLGSFARARTDG